MARPRLCSGPRAPRSGAGAGVGTGLPLVMAYRSATESCAIVSNDLLGETRQSESKNVYFGFGPESLTCKCIAARKYGTECSAVPWEQIYMLLNGNFGWDRDSSHGPSRIDPALRSATSSKPQGRAPYYKPENLG